MLLGPDDDLPAAPWRVLVNGTSGSGKSHLARRLGAVTGAPYVELDALHHGPGWVPRDTFLADATELAARPEWITEWQYSQVRETFLERCTLVVWVDPPRRQQRRQVLARTLRRRLTRQELWNGNVEPPLWTILTDRDHILRWAWRTHERAGERVRDLLERRPELPVVRLRSRAEADAWLARLSGRGGTPAPPR